MSKQERSCPAVSIGSSKLTWPASCPVHFRQNLRILSNLVAQWCPLPLLFLGYGFSYKLSQTLKKGALLIIRLLGYQGKMAFRLLFVIAAVRCAEASLRGNLHASAGSVSKEKLRETVLQEVGRWGGGERQLTPL